MAKEIFVASKGSARDAGVPLNLFPVSIIGAARKDIVAYMHASNVMDVIDNDKSYTLIIADGNTKTIFLQGLSSEAKNVFTLLEKQKAITLQNK